MCESTTREPAVGLLERQAEVHRVDHVGGVGQLRQDLDGAAGSLDGRDQGEPLLAGPQRVRLVVEVHERVDRVVHPEVVRLDHQVVAAPRQCVVHVRLLGLTAE